MLKEFNQNIAFLTSLPPTVKCFYLQAERKYLFQQGQIKYFHGKYFSVDQII